MTLAAGEDGFARFLASGSLDGVGLGDASNLVNEVFGEPEFVEVWKPATARSLETWVYDQLQITLVDGSVETVSFDVDEPKRDGRIALTRRRSLAVPTSSKKGVCEFLEQHSIAFSDFPGLTFEDQEVLVTEGRVLIYFHAAILTRLSATCQYMIC